MSFGCKVLIWGRVRGKEGGSKCKGARAGGPAAAGGAGAEQAPVLNNGNRRTAAHRRHAQDVLDDRTLRKLSRALPPPSLPADRRAVSVRARAPQPASRADNTDSAWSTWD